MISRLFILLQIVAFAIAVDLRVLTTSIPVGATVNYNVSNILEYRIKIVNMTFKIDQTPPRVAVTCLACTESNPVLVVVRQNKGVLSWELPLDVFAPKIYNQSAYYSTARTLCPFDIVNRAVKTVGPEGDVTLSLSTSSPINLTVTLYVTEEKQFILGLGEDHEIREQINPATPRFYAYQFPNDNVTDAVLLQVSSTNDICMSVSVQNIQCPVFDLERNVEFDGFFQSVTQSGSITVSRDDFPNGFYAVLVVRGHDSDCDRETFLESLENRTKTVKIKILPTISKQDFELAVATALGGLVLFAVVFFFFAFYYLKGVHDWYPIVDNVDDPSSSISAIKTLLLRSSQQS